MVGAKVSGDQWLREGVTMGPLFRSSAVMSEETDGTVENMGSLGKSLWQGCY